MLHLALQPTFYVGYRWLVSSMSRTESSKHRQWALGKSQNLNRLIWEWVYFSKMLKMKKESSLSRFSGSDDSSYILPVKSEVDHPGSRHDSGSFVFSRNWAQASCMDGRKRICEWFDGEVPKICHICDNVYRYPVDNGSMITRGLRNMINAKLAEILEVQEFLTVLVRRGQGNIRLNISAMIWCWITVSTRVVKWSEP